MRVPPVLYQSHVEPIPLQQITVVPGYNDNSGIMLMKRKWHIPALTDVVLSNIIPPIPPSNINAFLPKRILAAYRAKGSRH